MQGQILQFAGSLLAILLLAGIARALHLGAPPKLRDDAAALFHADQAVDGFDPVEIARDRDGNGAILRDRQNRILLLKPHGAHFAARLATPRMVAKIQDGMLIIQTGERRFGDVSLQVGNAPYWADAINAVNITSDA